MHGCSVNRARRAFQPEQGLTRCSFLGLHFLSSIGFRLFVTLFRVTSAYGLYLQKHRRKRTFRFVPFALASTLPFPFATFFGDIFSFGFTEKNPSKRPCCLLFRNFCSLSAPFLTRSSLINGSHQQSQKNKKKCSLESFFCHQKLYQPVHVGIIPLQLERRQQLPRARGDRYVTVPRPGLQVTRQAP